MANFTAIATGAAANAATVNAPLGQLDTALGNLAGVSTTAKTAAGAINELYASIVALDALVPAQGNQLIAWAESGAYQLATITYDGTYTSVVSTATVLWPDGSAGTFTTTTINTTWQAIDAYTISHTDSGLTVTQTAVTRNVDGEITTKPYLTVA